MTIKCSKCGGTDILQEASLLLDPNDPDIGNEPVNVGQLTWEDFFYCKDCEDEVHATEVDA